ncbi:hypothetical protein PFDG_05278 [Plasmodium falciparum Dd2]|uniref:Uncharacterized protein n=1 Tax=Plasmodium falciparum (isolate Dd2) TaxID=57267 RepID=A0A0L7MAV2_PLAF4|nr:hypothetical protein PFDG_05278 [Plasmodium falciparum Dd2]
MKTYTCDETNLSESLNSRNDLFSLSLFKHWSYILDYLLLLNGNNISEWYRLKTEECKTHNIHEKNFTDILTETDINEKVEQTNSHHFIPPEENQIYNQVDNKNTSQITDTQIQACEEKYVIYKRTTSPPPYAGKS